MSKFEFDMAGMFDEFCELAAADMTRSVKRAISKGAKALQDRTKQNLAGVIKTRNNRHWYNGSEITYNDKIDDGVRRTKVYENADEEWETKVHVLGTSKSGSGTYRLRFLEGGTKERTQRKIKGKPLKSPRRLGSIAGRRFFQAAKADMKGEIQNIYLKEIAESIKRMNDKK